MEVDKMGEKVNNGQKGQLAASECVVAVLKALSPLEGAYQLPQAGDYLPSCDYLLIVELI